MSFSNTHTICNPTIFLGGRSIPSTLIADFFQPIFLEVPFYDQIVYDQKLFMIKNYFQPKIKLIPFNPFASKLANDNSAPSTKLSNPVSWLLSLSKERNSLFLYKNNVWNLPFGAWGKKIWTSLIRYLVFHWSEKLGKEKLWSENCQWIDIRH